MITMGYYREGSDHLIVEVTSTKQEGEMLWHNFTVRFVLAGNCQVGESFSVSENTTISGSRAMSGWHLTTFTVPTNNVAA